MNNISPDFTNTTVTIKPLEQKSVLHANQFLERLPGEGGFKVLPLISGSEDNSIKAMLLIPESQWKDLTSIPSGYIDRALKGYDDLRHQNTDKLTFRAVPVNDKGELEDKVELVSFSRKALLTVLSNSHNLHLVKNTLLNPRLSINKVLEKYDAVQVSSAIQENARTQGSGASHQSSSSLLSSPSPSSSEDQVTKLEGEVIALTLGLRQQADALINKDAEIRKLQAQSVTDTASLLLLNKELREKQSELGIKQDKITRLEQDLENFKKQPALNLASMTTELNIRIKDLEKQVDEFRVREERNKTEDTRLQQLEQKLTNDLQGLNEKEQKLQVREQAVAEGETKLQENLRGINARQQGLDQRQTELDQREAKLDKREAEGPASTDNNSENLTGEGLRVEGQKLEKNTGITNPEPVGASGLGLKKVSDHAADHSQY